MDTSGGIVTRNGHGAITAVITSFGYAHSEPPPGIVIDIRKHLRDPHVSPELREMTGLDLAVISKVLGTTGADELINGLVAMATVLLPGATRANRLVRIAIGCVGGRHRSVVIADVLTTRLELAGWGAEVEHLHVNRPVVPR